MSLTSLKNWNILWYSLTIGASKSGRSLVKYFFLDFKLLDFRTLRHFELVPKSVLPEGLGWKSPLYLSKIPTCPHQIFLPKIPTFCKNFPTFFKKSNNFLKKIPTFCYNFPTFLKNLTIFKKISTFCRKRQKFQSPLEKNDPHQTPQNPHGGDKSPLPATLPKIYIVAILGMFATELFDQRVTLVFDRPRVRS